MHYFFMIDSRNSRSLLIILLTHFLIDKFL